MKYLAIIAILFGISLGLGSYHPSKPKAENQNIPDIEYILVTIEQGDELLKTMDANNQELRQLSNDLTANCDAIIEVREDNSKIIQVIEENVGVLSSEQ